MKAALIYRSGGPENFVLEDLPLPEPKSGWVLVQVKAFGLNRSELMTRKGFSPDVSFPRVLGIECVGEVINDLSGEFQPGQKVAAFMGGMGRDFNGSYAEFALLPKPLLSSFESQLSWEQLGAMPEMFQTVYGSLHLSLKIQPGETILIRGGSSSVGLLAAQLAKNSGLTVIATTRNPDKKEMLLKNGADQVMIDNGDLTTQIHAVYPFGINKVLELIGTATLKDSLSCAAPGGIVCMTGMLAEQWSFNEFAPMEYIPATVSLTVYDSGQIRVDVKNFQQFIRDVEAGEIKLPVGRTFILADIAAAHQLMDSNAAGGKVVVLP
ncbi:zinc-binding alcohol dehydrogenase family protein [Mucilaginibacter sp. AW1-7]|jgi:NADPH:quinone reductase-like Zn-dependent oxidoreductase|uniref:zinc-binding alcohol dehydrogenase family protein n=1 Tax=Mucilaginibacter sp. AW1-7 TaxID=3349874 RepID=UPI003F73E6DF